jgi:hypothetical protein
MTKTQPKRSITKASTSKTSATKTSSPTSDDICLLVLGFDEQQKPCGARFVGDNADSDDPGQGFQLKAATIPIEGGQYWPVGTFMGSQRW